jgi:hypothetical protein
MPMPGFAIGFKAMRSLGEQYQRLVTESNKYAPRNGAISVGGEGWMDNFFRAEAIRGLLSALRKKSALPLAIAEGIVTCEDAIDIWNKRREWQVHRSKCWIEDFIKEALRKATR